MGKTLRAAVEKVLRSNQVPLSEEEIQLLLRGWMDGVRPELESLFADMGRAARLAIDQGQPCDFSTFQEVQNYIIIL